MDRADRWVVGFLAGGVALILLGILLVALFTRVPLSHLEITAQGAQILRQAGVPVQAARDWPGAYRVTPQASDAAFSSTATLYFPSGKTVQLPRRDVLLWVYRG
ncbi:hypothetical protein [Acidithiobacillus sp. AMEEHan]|uniref:hypothetical protein n=1 Tax=Acidithiobacillus sp. AMEEHan TaxID=2994951 RepID=UPI0027E5158D|nr:hypothetical protein [Acidithiobacillus sp. AMEEHan]